MNKRVRRLLSLTMATVMMFSIIGTAMAEQIDYEEDEPRIGIWSDEDPITIEGPSERSIRRLASTARDISYPTYVDAYNAMIALKTTYPEGMTWTNFTPYGRDSNPYQDAYWFRGGAVKGARGGVGCAAFAFILSDAAFGDIPAAVYDNGSFTYESIKVGDILRVNNSHFVIVLQKTDGGVVVAEGNYNKSVHWGRTMSKDEVMAANFIVTRYPVDYVDPDTEGADEVKQSGSEGTFTWTLTNAGTLTIAGSGAMPDYSPNDNYLPSWNDYANDINAIVIENGVTGIGNYAFYHTRALSVSIPSTVTAIGNSAFEGFPASNGWSSNLVSVTIPGSVRSIGANAFRNCASLTSVSISEGLNVLGDNAFRACTSLQYIDFPASITSVGAGAFTDCSNLISIRFSPGAASVSVGDNPFTNCKRLMYVTLPEKLDSISNGMFSGCNSLQYLCIPAGVKQIYELGGAGGSPFMQTSISLIDFGGSEAEWISKGGKQALINTNGGGANVTVRFNVPFNNPFAPSPDDPGDFVYEPHEHNWSQDWSSNSDYHWHECLNSNCPLTDDALKDSYASHAFGDWITDKEATSTEEGSRHRDCTTCAYCQTEAIPATGEPEPPEHEHAWSTDWSNNGSYHWHDCLNANCPVASNDQKDSYAAHIFENWVTDKEATATEAGSRHRDCSVCAYRQVETIPETGSPTPPAHQHAWSTSWNSSGTHHWHECTNIGCSIISNNRKNGYAAHTFGDWITDKAATSTEEGSQHRDCTVCSHRQTETIPATGEPEPPEHEHAWLTSWNSSETHHWHECGNDGCMIVDDETKDGYAAHSFGDWIIDKEATSVEEGSQHRDCTVCSHRQTETIPATGEPEPPEHEHAWLTSWNSNRTHHWHECGNEGCMIVDNDAKSGYAAHVYGIWVTDTPATAFQDGIRHRNCIVCSYQQTGTIPATGWYPVIPDGGSGNSGNGSNHNNSAGATSTPKPSDSIVTTVTDPQTGAITETTKNQDGSSVVVVKQKDGTISTSAISSSGKIAVEVKLSKQTVDSAIQSGISVALPITSVTPVKDITGAIPITVFTGKNELTKVSIPVTAPTAGTVAVIINADGSVSVVKNSVVVGNDIVVPLMNGSTVKIMDNGKRFSDVPFGTWSEDAVAFVSARELFSGTSDTTFDPGGQMTRAMFMTVLARLDGVGSEGGETWYSRGIEWAIAHGVSDGFNPNSSITREQMVTMLWRYLGSPIVDDKLSGYTDIGQISGYAQVAMHWAVKSGVVDGIGNGRLGPQERATRAQVAQMLKNLIENTTFSIA